jgi:hypothetical protein
METIKVKNCATCPVQSDGYCELKKQYVTESVHDKTVDDDCPLLSGGVLLVLDVKND